MAALLTVFLLAGFCSYVFHSFQGSVLLDQAKDAGRTLDMRFAEVRTSVDALERENTGLASWVSRKDEEAARLAGEEDSRSERYAKAEEAESGQA